MTTKPLTKALILSAALAATVTAVAAVPQMASAHTYYHSSYRHQAYHHGYDREPVWYYWHHHRYRHHVGGRYW